MYGKAIDLYRQFIDTYSDSDYVYEFSFLEGEALFYAERYPEAIVQYRWVRDHKDMGTTYYLDAARPVLQSLEAEAAAEVAANKLQPLKIPSVADLQAIPQPWQPQPIPATYVDLQAEYDNYQNVVPDPAAAPQQGINAALISLAYLHTDDAIRRFQKVEENFRSQFVVPGTEVALPKLGAGAWMDIVLKTLSGDRVPAAEMRAAEDIITSDNIGVVPPAYSSELKGVIDPSRPFMASTRRLDTPASGMQLVVPVITQRPTVAQQMTEKAIADREKRTRQTQRPTPEPKAKAPKPSPPDPLHP
jgi:hypothetical protein